MTVVVRRSAMKMWLLAMGSIPLIVLSIDIVWNRELTNRLREVIFRPEDTQIFEPRDEIYAWALILFTAGIIGWTLKELFLPTKLIECREEGLAVKLRGPMKGLDLLVWESISDVVGGEIDDEGDRIPVLNIMLFERGDLPAHPWGARWVGESQLAVLGEDWAETPDEVANQIADCAVEIARKRHRAKLTGQRSGHEEEE